MEDTNNEEDLLQKHKKERKELTGNYKYNHVESERYCVTVLVNVSCYTLKQEFSSLRKAYPLMIKNEKRKYWLKLLSGNLILMQSTKPNY